jgi:hypothetical protein
MEPTYMGKGGERGRLEEIPSNFMPFSSLNYLQASHAQLALEWSMLCQECTDCWTKDGEYHPCTVPACVYLTISVSF